MATVSQSVTKELGTVLVEEAVFLEEEVINKSGAAMVGVLVRPKVIK